MFYKPKEEIIKEILNYGTEQKAFKTRNLELKQTENEIIYILQRKLLYKDKFLSTFYLRKIVSSMPIEPGNPKVQAQEIIRKLVSLGIKKLEMRILLLNCDFFEFNEFFDCRNEKNVFFISSDDFPSFRNLCFDKNIKYKILESMEVKDEIIV